MPTEKNPGHGGHTALRVVRPGERRSLSRSATRALDVMEYFGVVQRPLKAVEIARALDINPSTTNQLLKTMVGSGHLVFDAKPKTYTPSTRLTEFGGWLLDMYGRAGKLRRMIGEISEATGMVITVTAPNDLFMQIVDSVIPAGQTAERGLRVSVFGSATGGAYLTMLGVAEMERLADRARIPAGELPRLHEEAARIRAAGYAQGCSADDAIWSVAVPLPRQGLHYPTVLGLAGPVEQVRERSAEFAGVIQDAIRRHLEHERDD